MTDGMGLVYLPTFTIQIHQMVGKYTIITMDPLKGYVFG